MLVACTFIAPKMTADMCSMNTTNSLPIRYQNQATGRSSSFCLSWSPHAQHGMHSSNDKQLHMLPVWCLWSIRYLVTYTGLQVTGRIIALRGYVLVRMIEYLRICVFAWKFYIKFDECSIMLIEVVHFWRTRLLRRDLIRTKFSI